MKYDPRLADPALLKLAAWRLTHGPPLPTAWETQDGLANLLEYAKRLPPRDPDDIPGVYENAPGFGHLLWEARQHKEDADGAP